MNTVDMNNWSIQLSGSHPALAGTAIYKAPELLAFATSLDMLTHLTADGSQQTPIQNHVRSRLSNDPIADQWHSQRKRLRDQPHFKRYRNSTHSKKYHEAARALTSNTASNVQILLAEGLCSEIQSSGILIPKGQVVFHGRPDFGLHSGASFPTFVSTSLDPTVAIYHAMKKWNAIKCRPVVYQLSLRDDLPAIWGNGGGLKEWELLLQYGLSCTVSQIHTGSRFDIVEATIGR